MTQTIAQRRKILIQDHERYEHQLKNAQDALDDAAIGGRLAEVQSIQSEIAGYQALIESCKRRAEQLDKEDVQAERAARRKANAEAVEKYHAATSNLLGKSRKVVEAADKLVEALQAFDADARAARGHYYDLVRHLPPIQKNSHFNVMHMVSFCDTMPGVALSEQLHAAGVFTTLMPVPGVSLVRHDIARLDEVVATRLARYAGRVKEAHEAADRVIDEEADE